MSFTHEIIETVRVGDLSVENRKTITAENAVSYDVDVAVANNVAVAMTLDVSAVKSIYILSDQDLLLETNNSSSPTNTLSLKSGIPYVWYTNKYSAFVFTSDVTSLYATNASSGTARLQIEILTDPTP